MTLAWHFAPRDLKLGYGDGRKIVVGETLTVSPQCLKLCKYGLHGSVRILDALQHAPGLMICRVELGGRMLVDTDKICAETRRVIACIDGEAILLQHARESALSVAHLWAMPDVVRQFLETGDESLRAAAWDAARDAARDAAWAAAMAAARAAAWAAAEDAAGAAAGDAARDAARDAAWDAAWAGGGRGCGRGCGLGCGERTS